MLWKATGLTLKKKTNKIVSKGKTRRIGFFYPEGLGKWYFSIGQGMGKTLTFADEKQGYTLVDRGTYINYKFGRKMPINLAILYEGDDNLANPYGVIPVSPQKHPHVKYDLAKEFIRWLLSKRGQSVIANYKLLGKQLFFPDVIK